MRACHMLLVVSVAATSCNGGTTGETLPPKNGSEPEPSSPEREKPHVRRVALPRRPPEQQVPTPTNPPETAKPSLPKNRGHGMVPHEPSNPPPPLDVPHSVDCGSSTCDPQSVPGFGFVLRPCCLDASKASCGIASGSGPSAQCVSPSQSATPDPKCPSGGLLGFPAVTLKGCCRPSGKCGYILSFPNGPSLGCVDAADVGASSVEVSCQ